MPTALQPESSYLYTYYSQAEEEFVRLIQNCDLDSAIKLNPGLMTNFEDALSFALVDTYKNNNECGRAHLFLQRVLYYINRLKLFWYDELNNYSNENSRFLFDLHKKIENLFTNLKVQNTLEITKRTTPLVKVPAILAQEIASA